MNKRLFLLVVCLLASCAAPAALAPTSIVNPPTATLPTLSPTNTVEPTPMPLPPGMVSYYRIRVEYSITSDWSTLDLISTANILAIKIIETKGQPTSYEAGVQRLFLNQPLAESATGKSVSLIVDYALAPGALVRGLDFRLQKGDIGSGTVSVFLMAGETPETRTALAAIQND